jgi:hypothetical protein
MAGKNAARKSAPTPKPSVSAITLAACIKTTAGPWPRKEEEVSNEEENGPNQNNSFLSTFLSAIAKLSIN